MSSTLETLIASKRHRSDWFVCFYPIPFWPLFTPSIKMLLRIVFAIVVVVTVFVIVHLIAYVYFKRVCKGKKRRFQLVFFTSAP